MATQEPNPILKEKNLPIPQPIVGTRIGGLLINNIQSAQDAIKNGGIPQQQIPLAKKLINVAEKMLDYPESSNLENYVLFNEFLSDADKSTLIGEFNRILLEKSGNKKNELDLNKIVQDVWLPHVIGKIYPGAFLSLMILSSRLCTKYRISSNPECELFTNLNALFDGGNGANFDSAGLYRVILNFISTNKSVTTDYVKRILNGERIYEIYRDNYIQAGREISKKLILERLNKWLKVNHLNIADSIIDIPVSYIFNSYTNKEKNKLNKEASICNVIADLTGEIGTPTANASEFQKSVFNVENNDSQDLNKVKDFLYNISPAAVKKKADKNRKKSLRRKGKLGLH